MDNMLYIISGLVTILLIGVLILRRNQAQKPHKFGSSLNNTNLQSSPTEFTTPNQNTAKTVGSSSTRFDDLSIAQRFMDQQRYDKAIEAIQRGLITKPHCNQLTLKLLNIYAINNQQAEFHNTYAAIDAHGNSETKKEAQQLKALLDAEQQTQATYSTGFTINTSFDKNNTLAEIKSNIYAENNESDDLSLDFYIPALTFQHDKSTQAPKITNIAKNSLNMSNNNDDYILTLNNVEAADLESNILKDITKNTVNNNDTNLINHDFTFDFDQYTDKTSLNITADSAKDELSSNDNDFIVDSNYSLEIIDDSNNK